MLQLEAHLRRRALKPDWDPLAARAAAPPRPKPAPQAPGPSGAADVAAGQAEAAFPKAATAETPTAEKAHGRDVDAADAGASALTPYTLADVALTCFLLFPAWDLRRCARSVRHLFATNASCLVRSSCAIHASHKGKAHGRLQGAQSQRPPASCWFC
jgi:hypothetical protein